MKQLWLGLLATLITLPIAVRSPAKSGGRIRSFRGGNYFL